MTRTGILTIGQAPRADALAHEVGMARMEWEDAADATLLACTGRVRELHHRRPLLQPQARRRATAAAAFAGPVVLARSMAARLAAELAR
jgi:hypothetical protein